jgi:hypothetical protein
VTEPADSFCEQPTAMGPAPVSPAAPGGQPLDLAGIRQSAFPLGGVLAGAWQVFWARFWTILGITLLVYVPYELLSALFAPQGDSWQDVRRSFQIESGLSTLIGILATLATYLVVEGEAEGMRISVGRAMRHAVSRWRSGVATSLLWSLVVVVGLLVLVIPGLILAGMFAFTMCTVSLRDCSLREAMRYSKALVKGRWWSVVGVLMIIALMAFVPCFLVSLAVDTVRGPYLVGVADSLLADVLMSFLTVATAVYFLALDRREPEVRAEAPVAAEAGPELVELTPTPTADP